MRLTGSNQNNRAGSLLVFCVTYWRFQSIPGKEEWKSASFTRRAFQFNPSSVQLDEILGDCQAEAGAFPHASGSRAALITLIETRLLFRSMNAHTSIRDGNDDGFGLLMAFDGDLTFLRCEFDGVTD